MQQPSGTTGLGVNTSRHTETSSVTISPNRSESNDQSLSTSTNGENGNVFTLTNIYTFGVNGNPNPNPSTDKYRVKSFVEVFDQPSTQQETEYERHYRETHSSSTITRKIHTSSNDYQVTNSSLTGSEFSKS
jgi:hypothetical protein